MKKSRRENDTSILGRIFYSIRTMNERLKAFRPFGRISDRQKRLAGYAGNAPTANSRAAYIFGVLKVMFISLFVFLTIAILLFAGRIMSYDNVYYMFKDIGYISDYGEARAEALNYSKPVNNQYFTSFKNGLAVASDSELKFFTATGRVTLTEGLRFTDPKIVCSKSKALVYDSGRTSFSIYNSFVSLYSETLEYPISYAAISDNGSFVVVTKSKKYSSVVRMYDSDFNLIREYFKNDYVISAELSDNGKYLAIMSLDANGGESMINLNILKMSNGEIISSVSITGDMPYRCMYVTDNKLALICRERTLIYDIDGKQRGECIYPADVSDYCISDGYVALAFSADSLDKSSTVVIYDENGKSKLVRSIDGKIIDIVINDHYLYVLLDREIMRIDTVYGTVSKTNSFEGATKLLTLADGAVACTEAAAYYLTFK